MTSCSVRFIVLSAIKIGLVVLTMQACQPNTETEMTQENFDLQNSSPQKRAAASQSLDQIFGRWAFVSLNGAPVIVAEDGGKEEETYVEFTSPCYEVGDGHCNEALDGSWEPSENRFGRLGLKGYSGCNWFGSEAILEGGSLISKAVMSTQRLCSDVMPQEIRIQKILSETPSINFRAGALEFTSAVGDSLVAERFSKLDRVGD